MNALTTSQPFWRQCHVQAQLSRAEPRLLADFRNLKRLLIPLLFCLLFAALNAGAATYNLGTSTILVGPAASSNSVTLAVTPETGAWTASTNATWLHLPNSFQSGVGSTNVIFTVDANSGATRSGTMTISGQTFTVTQAGSTYVPAGPATLIFGRPFADGLSLDSAGNVYIAVAAADEILEWTPANNTATPVVTSGLVYPTGVAVDSGGNIYIANQDANSINNGSTVVVGANNPRGVAVDGAGDVYIADYGDGLIEEWIPSSSTLVPLLSVGGVAAVAADKAGKNVYFDNGNLQVWTAANSNLTQLATSGFGTTYGAAVDGEGNVYLAAQNASIAQFAIMKWCAASNTFNPIVASGMAEYFGVAVDGSGNLYYSDAYDGTVQEIPNAFLDISPKTEGLAAGQDSLSPIVPSTVNLLAPFTPKSDSSWLTIVATNNGVVTFAFTQNIGLPRTGHISLLGQSIAIKQLGPVFTLGTSNLYEGPQAGNDSVALGVAPNIGIWTATNNNISWLHLNNTNNLSGTGSTNIVFTFDANPGTTRTGTITIAGQTVTITQAGYNYVQAGALTSLVSSGLNSPRGVAVDRAGNVYIADTTNNAVEKWTPTNNSVTTLISSGLANPSGIAVDTAGNVYIADTGNNAIKEWTTNGTVTTVVSAGLVLPQGVAVDNSGNIYIADTGNNAVEEWIAASNTLTTLVSSGLANPSGVAVDVAGNIYIADTGNNAVEEWTAAAGSVSPLVSSGLQNPDGVAVDGKGNVYIADTGDNAIKEWIATSNTVTTLISSGLLSPAGVAVDGIGNLFVAGSGDNQIDELPRAFVSSTSIMETANAGSGVLPVVVPSTENLLAPFTPTSDQPWLTITGVTSGVVGFSFGANSGSSQTAHISLLGHSITVTQAGLTYILGTTSLLLSPYPASDSIVLGVAPNTASWTATANASWLHLNQSGTGGTNIVFSVDANTGDPRAGTMTIAGHVVTVNQVGSAYVPAGTLGTMLSSGLSGPENMALDASGNIYIADTVHHAVEEWTPTNNHFSTLISSGLSQPVGVAVDGSGNVYVSDSGLNVIKEWLAASSNVITVVSSGLDGPSQIAMSGAGNLYIADRSHNAIQVWSPANNTLTPLISSGLSLPFGVAVDVAGNVYVGDLGDRAIKKWSLTTSNLTTLFTSSVIAPYGMAVDGDGNVYFAEIGGASYIGKWNPVNNFTQALFSNSGLSSPMGVVVDAVGNIYIADTGHNAIKEFPYVFVAPTSKYEGLSAGIDNLPSVLPITANLLPPFAPTSDQSWLAILHTFGDSVTFDFTTNSGPARTGHILVLGQTNTITQGSIGSPSFLTEVQIDSNNAFKFSFTNDPSASLTILSSTNLALPLASWAVVGTASNVSSNLFQFTWPPVTNDQGRYFMVRSP